VLGVRAAGYIRIIERTADCLESYAAVSIAFEVAEIIDLDSAQSGTQAVLKTRNISAPYIKNYDLIAGNHPSDWPTRYHVSGWTIFTAHDDARQIGGVIVVGDAALIPESKAMLVWDFRVEPEARHRGVGRSLLAAAEGTLHSRGVRTLYVETQDVNVGACRFYERQGFLLSSIARNAYPQFPGESRLMWKKLL